MLHILHLEDSAEDAFLIEQAFVERQIEAIFKQVKDRAEFLPALEEGGFDLVLADSSLPGIDGVEALKMVRQKYPEVPMIAVSGAITEKRAQAVYEAGVSHYVLKDELWQLIAAVRVEMEKIRLQQINRGRARLIQAVEELSLARDLDAIMGVVRKAARELTGADGASFVLRDGDKCFYAEENAIGPLWKGQRFPIETCISGWAMLNRQPAVIKDIYADSRIPADAYRPTFVKSLAIVPIRTEEPIGAIGNYWAKQRMPTPDEVELLQALANTTAVAMENVQVYDELEKRVKDRTAELESVNRELETFSYAVSHDLKAPLRSILGFAGIMAKSSADKLDEKSRVHLETILSSGKKMSGLIDDLLKLAKYSRTPLKKRKVDLSEMAREITARLAEASPEREVSLHITDGLEAEGDAGLLQAVLENLLSNAWKYSSKNQQARIVFDAMPPEEKARVYFIRDNGAGFDMQAAQKLFQPFQRLHSEQEFAGTGVGLATVHRIIQRHDGHIWAEAAVGKGATFYFSLPL
ncbi:MAG: ATP-binding protein [Methylacidiphilales bacterium]|nr:ATP-binding protein [Candidatus Methylacidiphilales bacterium]